jgi:MYXO-CTERM domain-containing protein
MNNQKNCTTILSIVIAVAVVGVSSNAEAGLLVEWCGDGVIQNTEECDDGNLVNWDGCNELCEIDRPVCGNGAMEGPEECDDSNHVDGDGCNQFCKIEGCLGADADQDTVCDPSDICPDTLFPEDVPTVLLGVNRYALVTDDPIFDTVAPVTKVMNDSNYTIERTGGCSCEQIIDALGLDEDHTKYGCSGRIMKGWISMVGDVQPLILDGDELDVEIPEQQMGCSVDGQTRPAWAFLGLLFAAVGLRRRA